MTLRRTMMRKPPSPLDETQRLASLRALHILDTPPEARFDRITRMARRMFEVDICVISLVDANRQWFKSRQGIDVSETPREISFCAHAILNDEVFIVGDAAADPRFEDNPLVAGEPHVRFYAGCPIRGPEGHRIGTLSLIDSEPRGLSIDDQATLKDLAALVEDELDVSAQMTIDGLTGIANRRGFHTVAGHLLSLCRRTGTEAELVFLELDGVPAVDPAVRDSPVRCTADDGARRFADLLIRCFRSADVVARIEAGGFAVLLTASGDSSIAALKRLAVLADSEGSDALRNLRWVAGTTRFDSERHRSVEDMLGEVKISMDSKRPRRRETAS
jgi:GGDEF domain-containing protein